MVMEDKVIFVRYTNLKSVPFTKEELMIGADPEIGTKIRGYAFGMKCKQFYKTMMGLNLEQGKKKIDIEEMKEAVIEAVRKNEFVDFTALIYHCQSTDIDDLELADTNYHNFFRACKEVKQDAIVLKGLPE